MIHIARYAAAFCSAIVLISQTGCGWYGARNSAVATPSTANVLVATVGASQTYSVTFNSSDEHPLRSLVVTTDLKSLGQGWNGPASFTCAVVTTGSGCVLNLTYAPTSPDSGTVVIDFTYRDDHGTSRTASQHVDYSATASNNVEAVVSPSGQINAVVGASAQSVGVNFTTDDGNQAAGLELDLSSLPAGWSSTATTFSCATVSIGNGCQLTLSYAPAARGSGTLSLNYSYSDNSGTAKSGGLNIPYSATTQNDVVATATPNGQVNAIVGGGSQSVSVQFTTNDGNPATGLGLTIDLTALPAGWSSPDTSFNCQIVSTGNGCQLPLVYAPGAAGSGMLTLAYTYSNNSGALRNGSLNIPYAATTHDNAVATVFPSGQIDAIAGSGSQAVTITFTTDDGNVGTSLHLTSSLSALPAGWSSTLTGLSCATFSTGNTCSLPLSFAPGAASSGTLPLNYTYYDDSGAPKSGSVSISYRATANDNVVGTPEHSTLSVMVGSSITDDVTFTTDDGNTAGTLTITTALGSLPAGWSSTASGFSCPNVSAGTACKLPLTYAPSTTDNGTLVLNYSYTDNSGTAKTGSVNVAYTATTPQNVYVTDYIGNTVSYCPTNADGTLGACVSTGSGFVRPTSITFFGNRAYVTNDANYTVSVCTVATGGALSNCASAGSLNEPQRVTINPAGTFAYIWDNFGVNLCAINASDGTFSSCTQTGIVASSGNLIRFPVISADGARMYGTWYGGGGYDMMHFHPINLISLCPIESDGTVPTCVATGTNADNANLTFALTASDLYASSQGGGVIACPVNADGSLGSCQSTAPGSGSINGLAVGSNYAYLVAFDATIKVCPVGVDGLLGACTVLAPGGFSALSAVAIH